jgi:hypothetical protein
MPSTTSPVGNLDEKTPPTTTHGQRARLGTTTNAHAKRSQQSTRPHTRATTGTHNGAQARTVAAPVTARRPSADTTMHRMVSPWLPAGAWGTCTAPVFPAPLTAVMALMGDSGDFTLMFLMELSL